MIIKRKHSGSYAVIPNTISDDQDLKADTLGVLVYLLAKPADWKVIVADLCRRFHIGRNRVYAIIRELEVAGYVQRIQNRAARSRWGDTEYYVFDCPQALVGEPDIAGEGQIAGGEVLPDSPLPQNGDTVEPQQNTASPFTVYRPTACGKRAHILSTNSTKPLRDEKNSAEAGADAPSVSKKVWKEGLDLLKDLPSKPNRSIIGKWLKRVPSIEGKEKLLAIIHAARLAGTADPIAYVTKALDREYPPPPDPRQLNAETWQRYAQAAIKTRSWSEAWGPRPGKKGCLMPPELINAQLTNALSERRISEWR